MTVAKTITAAGLLALCLLLPACYAVGETPGETGETGEGTGGSSGTGGRGETSGSGETNEGGATGGRGGTGGASGTEGAAGTGGTGGTDEVAGAGGTGIAGSSCGNDRIDPDEQCDGDDLGNETCASLGAGAGDLRCGPSCFFDLSSCSSTSGCAPDCDAMVSVPAGSFWMGCNQALDDDCSSDEYPYHEVQVDEFEIDKYEVTVERYRACVNDGTCTEPTDPSAAMFPTISPQYVDTCNYHNPDTEQYPVNCVTWEQASTFCKWAGKRLPSEAEWEKAARGTDGRIYPWGNQAPTCDYAVMYDSVDGSSDGCGTGKTMMAGSKPGGASPYGAIDMAGNVAEWVVDWYHENYLRAPTDGRAWEVPLGNDRLLRGGSFNSAGHSLRASDRLRGDMLFLFIYVAGFRCAI